MSIDWFFDFDLSTSQWAWVIFCALCIGLAKTGLSGLGLLVVPILASVFGPRESTGVLLPMLIMADIFAVVYYHRHADFKLILKLAPATIAGVLFAIWVGDSINDETFGILMATIIIIGLGIMIWNELRSNDAAVPHNWYFASFAGVLGGFTTMIGNAAGPVMSIYFLSLNLKKNNFIGTGAWFFLLVNLFKVPFHITVWETISMNSFVFNIKLFPIIMVGAFAGIYLVKKIPEKPYRYFIIISSGLAAFKLFF
jgi:uncharacterized membrane protein YfcA